MICVTNVADANIFLAYFPAFLPPIVNACFTEICEGGILKSESHLKARSPESPFIWTGGLFSQKTLLILQFNKCLNALAWCKAWSSTEGRGQLFIA